MALGTGSSLWLDLRCASFAFPCRVEGRKETDETLGSCLIVDADVAKELESRPK